MNAKSLGYTFAFTSVFLWAGNFVLARGLADAIAPVQLNFWRWVVALLVVFPFALRNWGHDWQILKKNLPYICLMGLIGVTCLNAFFYQAGSTTSSINMVLFVPSAPIIIMLLSRIFCGEPITPRRLLGLTIILSGLLLLLSRGQWSNLTHFRISSGDLWSIGGVVCFGLYSFLARYRPHGVSLLALHSTIFIAGLLFSLPALLWEMHVTAPTEWNMTIISGILYAGIGCSSLAYVFWTKAIDSIGPVAAGMIYYSIPLFTALKGVLILGEKATMLHFVGGALMLFGIALATIPPKLK